MVPWIVGAAVLVIAWALYKKSQTSQLGGVSATTGTIVIDLDGGKPRVKTCPRKLFANPNEPLTWAIENDTNQVVDVWLRDFTHENAGKKDPLQKNEADRRKKCGPKDEITDRVKSAGGYKGKYTYAIYLDGALAKDPDLEVMM